jgi:hypothetical protein
MYLCLIYRFVIYGLTISPQRCAQNALDLSMYMIMLYPLVFVMGWLPHAGTFILTLLEQLNIHAFGGTGCISLLGTILIFTADVIVTCLLVAIGYYSASMCLHVLLLIS